MDAAYPFYGRVMTETLSICKKKQHEEKGKEPVELILWVAST
jgi:hypothetical protein